jgi:hypothetical protein
VAGFIQIISEWFYRTDDATYGLDRGSISGDWTALEEELFPIWGDWTQVRDFYSEQEYTGYRQVTFFEDFYNRIHFSPAALDFGAISQATIRQVSIWNAYLTPVELESITTLAADNVSFTPPPDVPYTFNPLQARFLSFTAAEDGTASFFDYTIFGFDVGDYEIPTYGERAILTEIGPNWQQGVVEVLSFLTEIVNVSRDGKEQRRALRREPRRSIEYTLNLWGANRRKVEAQLYKWRRRTAVVVLDPYRVKTAADALSGALTVSVVGSVPPWAAAGVAVKFSHHTLASALTSEIESVTSDTITFATGLPVDLPTGTKIIWAMTGRLQDKTKISHLTDDVSTSRMKYENIPAVDPAYTPGEASDTFGDYELFLMKPNWKDPVAGEFQHFLNVVDFGKGRIEVYEHVDFAQEIRTVSFSGQRDYDILELTDFFRRQYGRLKEFYFPTWESDITLSRKIFEGDNYLRVEGTDMAFYYANQTTHRAVLIQLKNGTMIPMAVDEIYTVNDESGEDSIIHFTSAFEQDIELTQIKMISWLMRCRLASDNMEIKWLTDTTATTQLSFLTLEHLE